MIPKVSVVMPVYNREAFVSESVGSILDQTFEDFEFIIIDDGSTDRTVAIVQEHMQQDSRIRLVILPENVGIARATNRGINEAQGQYIALMDSDDVSIRTRLEHQVDYLDQHPDVDVLGTQMQVVDKHNSPLFIFDVPQQHSLIVWNLFFGRTFGNPSVMIRSDSPILASGYNHAFVPSHDIELWSRMAGQTRFANLPEILLAYRTHENSISIQKAEQKRAALYIVLKQLLQRLWGDEVSDQMITRFLKVRSGKPQFTNDEYELVAVDMQRLAQSMLANGWILSDEMPLIEADLQRLLQLAKPQKKRFWKTLLRKIKP